MPTPEVIPIGSYHAGAELKAGGRSNSKIDQEQG
jgi:hypothetical protein